MKVKELIHELVGHDYNAEVLVIYDSSDIYEEFKISEVAVDGDRVVLVASSF